MDLKYYVVVDGGIVVYVWFFLGFWKVWGVQKLDGSYLYFQFYFF